jgi:hypothetical protein
MSPLDHIPIGTTVCNCRNQNVLQDRQLRQKVVVLEHKADVAIAKTSQLRFGKRKGVLAT